MTRDVLSDLEWRRARGFGHWISWRDYQNAQANGSTRSCSPMVLHHFASHMTPPAYEIANSMTTADSGPAAADQRLWKIKRECSLGSQLSGSGVRPLLAGSARLAQRRIAAVEGGHPVAVSGVAVNSNFKSLSEGIVDLDAQVPNCRL